MRMIAERLAAWIRPTRVVHAHCDLPCGVYDPAQARIEAESMAKIVEKYQASDDEVFRTARHPDQGAARRAGQASPLGAVDRLLQAPAPRAVPEPARPVLAATKQAGEAKHSVDPADQQKLLDLIGEIDDIFQKSKSG
jgi:nickel superoxide dismutase